MTKVYVRRWLENVIVLGRLEAWLTLHWRHNDQDSVSNHQPHGCLLNRLFRRRSKKTSKLRVTGLCVGNSPGPVNSPHKGPVTRKIFPFDDVIMKPIDLNTNLVNLIYPLIKSDFPNSSMDWAFFGEMVKQRIFRLLGQSISNVCGCWYG